MSRRAMLRAAGCGFGMMGLQSLLAETRLRRDSGPAGPEVAHVPGPRQRVIFLFMHGGPSSIDTFDPSLTSIKTTVSRCRSNSRSRLPRVRPAA